MKVLRSETHLEGEGARRAGETEGARRATGVSPAAAAGVMAPDPEVVPKAQRRRFSPSYKLRVLQEAETCKAPGMLGALLRREGLYASHLTKWRKLYKQGGLAGLGPKRGRKPDPQRPELERMRELERENERLKHRLRQAEVIIEVQKKVSEILGIPLAQVGDSESGI
jgi:transposase